jgi:molybdate transport system substrate-binding protein
LKAADLAVGSPERIGVVLGALFALSAPSLVGAALVGVMAAPAPPLVISAAVSLTEPIQALARTEARQKGAPMPRFNFAASGVLQQQIQQGAPVDVFISAGQRQMEALEKAGLLLAGSRRNLIGNQLVLVVSSRSPIRSLSFSALGSSSITRIAIGDNSVPAGDYARQTLASYKLTAALQPRLVPLGSVRAVANAVAAGNVDAGIVYRSDALQVAGLRIVTVAPPATHAPIRYPGAVLKASRQPAKARAFLDSLSTPAAQQVFRRHGFSPLPVDAAVESR